MNVTASSGIMSVLLLLLGICTVGFLIKILWSRRWLYYYSYVFDGAMAWPIIGNAFHFEGEPEDFVSNFTKLLMLCKGLGRFWYFTDLFIASSNPKVLQVVLNQTLHKHDVYRSVKPIVGNGIFAASVDQWRKNRKKIMPTFNNKILESFVEVYSQHGEILVQTLEKQVGNGFIDMFPILNRCFLDILCETTLDTKIYTQDGNSEVIDWIGRAMEITYIRMYKAWYQINFIWKLSSLSRELDDISIKFRAFIKEIVLRKREEIELEQDLCIQDNFKSEAFLTSFIRSNPHLTDEEIIDEAGTITIAGSETSASAEGFVLIILGLFPDVQAKVYEELQSIFSDNSRNITYKDLNNMVYLDRVVKETLRIFPTVPIIARKVDKDIVINEKYTVPAGSSFAAGILNLHRDPNIWPNPEKFDPDRFLPEEVAKRDPNAFMPFSIGPRNCIGGRYALMSIKLITAAIVRKFQVSCQYKRVQDVRLKAALVMKSVDGVMIALENRHI